MHVGTAFLPATFPPALRFTYTHLSGYQAGNLYVAKHALDNVNAFSAAAAFGGTSGYDPKNDGALRGGAYLFLRYLYDQAGGDKLDAEGKVVDTEHGAAWLRGLVGSPEVGWKNTLFAGNGASEITLFGGSRGV